MTEAQRIAYAHQHLLIASELGFLSLTSCTRIAETYGIPHMVGELKAVKAKLFPEFACSQESGK